MAYIYLIGAIIAEVFGSAMMKLTAITNKKSPIIGIAIGYLIAFYLLALALLTIPLSFSYAVWSGVGTALTALVGYIVFKERMTGKRVFGIFLIIIGILLMKL